MTKTSTGTKPTKPAHTPVSFAQHACSFIEWSQRHGPFDTIVDGANVGMYNQHFEDAHFNFNQVEKLMALLRDERPADSKPALLVLHQRRVRGGPASAPRAVNIIKQWRENSACHSLKSVVQ